MSAAALTLIAILLEVEGGFAVADRGAADGLRPGDRGQAFYTLYVGSDRRPVRIDAGPIEVAAVEDRTARLEPAAGQVVRRGYSVEFRLPAARRPPPGGETGVEAGDRLSPPVAVERPAAALGPALAAPAMTPIPGGEHRLGSDLGKARFYNQTPRFRATLRPFRIDRTPVPRARLGDSLPRALPGGGRWATDLSFAEAEAYCHRLGKRLPTELEWEAAAHRSAIETGPLFEWTRSWYQPYPGNRFPEQEYGQRFRVLRGGGGDPALRRFMAPGESRADVGFRCARSDPESAPQNLDPSARDSGPTHPN